MGTRVRHGLKAGTPGSDRGILDENVGLEPLDRLQGPQERHRDQGQKVREQAPDDAMGQMVEMQIKQHFRPQYREAERPLLEKGGAIGETADQFRQQKRIGPDRKSGENGRGAPRAVARRHTKPRRNAGANCAMAANESRPISARDDFSMLS